MNESKADLTTRLRGAGLWPEASKRKDDKIKELRAEGESRRVAGEKAWEWLAAEYPPVERPPLADIVADEPEPSETVELEPGEPSPTPDPGEPGDRPPLPTAGRWESMCWVADALGKLAKKQKVSLADAPDDIAVGMFDWARDNREKFYGIYAAEGRRREDGGGEKKKAARKQIREMKRMLEETLVAAKRIELEAAEEAEERVKLERELDSFEGENGPSEGGNAN